MPRNKTLRILACALVFNFQLSIFNLSAQDSCRLQLAVENHHFFRNNEYGGEHLDGYTLPGFYLRPRLEWQVEPRVKLSLGAHWLHYWGARRYPSATGYATRPLPEASDTATAMHLLPWVQARVNFSPTVSLILGSLENRNGHGLPMPLYERELQYAADPEAGVQLLLQRPWLEADLWVNWHEFIFAHSDHQERFYIGLSSRFKWQPRTPSLELYLPLYALACHHGGESLTVYLRNHHQLNCAGGLGATYRQGDFSTGLEMLAYGYLQRKGSIHPFDRGWGLSATLNASYREGSLSLGYWRGEGFVPSVGSVLYSNVSTDTEGLTFDRNQLLTLRAEYRWKQFRACQVSLEGDLYHYLPWTGQRPGYGVVERGGRTMYAFGIHVKLNPTLPLLR